MRGSHASAARLALALLAWLHAAIAPAAIGTPPSSRAEATADSYFGVTIADPYRWLEEIRTPEVMAWFKAQDEYARAVLDRLPGRTSLRERIAELDAADTRITNVQFGGDDLFYLKRGPNDQVFSLYTRHGLDGPERLIADPRDYAGGDTTAAIDYLRASPNGKRVAFGVSTGGSENSTLFVIDVVTGKTLGEPVPRARDGSPSWRFDSAVLFYRQLKALPQGAPPSEVFRDSRAYARTYHSDGTIEDAAVLGRGLSPGVELEPDDVPSVVVSPVSPWAIGVVAHGVDREVSLYVAPLAQVRGAATPWRKLAGPERGITDFDLRGEWIYLVTHESAPNYRVVRASLNRAHPYQVATSEMVVAEGERVVTGIGIAKDALYVQQAEAGIAHLLRLEFNVKLNNDAPAARGSAPHRRAAPPRRGAAPRDNSQRRQSDSPRRSPGTRSSATARSPNSSRHPSSTASRSPPRRPAAPAALPKTAGIARARAVTLPFSGAIQERVTDPLRQGALLRLAGWTEAPAYFAVDGKSGALARTALLPRARADFSGIASRQLRVKSQDGVEVPHTIVYPRNSVRDGGAPLLLEGYGAYGYVQEPSFWPALLAWLERGGIYAIAHVRGGGDLGKNWHLAGRRETKANSWRDFIACGDYLVSERWTSHPRLAAMGASAGGITVGNAVATRPELFAAFVNIAGFHDPLRSETGAAGPANVPEFGTVASEPGFRGLLAMSPYAKIEPGTRYPAALLTTGFNDQRVDPWDPGKMAARLQQANGAPGGSGRPVLLRVDFAAGRGVTSTRDQAVALYADVFTFLFWQLGTPAYQPK